MPKVSIIIIAFNRAIFLPEAIDSVLSQSFTDWELILVDDGSVDKTAKIMSDYAVKDQRIRCFFNEKNIGICKARARGLEVARGEFVAVLDSDDIWCDTKKLEKQYNFLLNNPEYVLVGGGVIITNENNREIKRYLNLQSDTAIRRQLLIKNPFVHSTVMYRLEVARSVGGYKEDLKGKEINAIEDYDLWLRLGTKGKILNLPEYFVRYRVHSGSISIQKRLKLMETTLFIINNYRLNYPLFWLAWLRRNIRYQIYKMYKFCVK